MRVLRFVMWRLEGQRFYMTKMRSQVNLARKIRIDLSFQHPLIAFGASELGVHQLSLRMMKNNFHLPLRKIP
jgi:hypothetical protein